MIRTALEFVKKELEGYLVEREQSPADYSPGNVVELKPLMLPNGTFNITGTSHVTIMLVNLEEERKEGKRPRYFPVEDNKYMRLNPPVEIDLYLLFVAHNSDYPTALRDLSSVISFFQSNSVFDEKKFPSLNAAVSDPINKPWQLIERLSFQLHSLTFEQQNNLWAMLGPKYIPSLVYKAHMLTVFETKGKDLVSAIQEINYTEN
jgi:hypothetical protein